MANYNKHTGSRDDIPLPKNQLKCRIKDWTYLSEDVTSGDELSDAGDEIARDDLTLVDPLATVWPFDLAFASSFHNSLGSGRSRIQWFSIGLVTFLGFVTFFGLILLGTFPGQSHCLIAENWKYVD